MVESRPGAGADAKRRPGSRPRSSNRTCPFRASGFPTGFTVDSRTRPPLHITKPEYPQLAEDRFRWKAAGAARGHLVASPQEMPYALVDVIVDCPVCRRPGSVAVVCRPASEHPIEPIPHLRPRPDIARRQQVSHLAFDARLPDAGLRLIQGQSQPRDHPTLRSPAVAILPSRQPALPVFVPFLDRSRESHPDRTQHIPIHDSLSDTLHQFAVWNGVEVLG